MVVSPVILRKQVWVCKGVSEPVWVRESEFERVSEFEWVSLSESVWVRVFERVSLSEWVYLNASELVKKLDKIVSERVSEWV